jgi:hypothetical protein
MMCHGLISKQKSKQQPVNESEMKFCLFEITGDKEFSREARSRRLLQLV